MNILPKKTWEQMGKPRLMWSPIQLCLEDQYKIYPIERLENVLIYLKGITTRVDFEVIELEEEAEPHPSLLEINWAFDNNAIINMKKSNYHSLIKYSEIRYPIGSN